MDADPQVAQEPAQMEPLGKEILYGVGYITVPEENIEIFKETFAKVYEETKKEWGYIQF